MKRKVITITLALLLMGCGGSISLQSVLAGSGPLLNYLVKKGQLTQERADTLKVDFTDAGKCADALQVELKGIADNAPDARLLKLNAWSRASKCWKPIVLRQHFAVSPRVQEVANLIDGIFAAGIVFYSEPGEIKASAQRAPIRISEPESRFEQDIDRRLEELKAALKPE